MNLKIKYFCFLVENNKEYSSLKILKEYKVKELTKFAERREEEKNPC